ncbi:MAG: transposase, partial [Fidelibacterota bacterium]
MEDYPKNILEFETRFNSEESCRDYLFQLRWPNGFKCPHCGHEKSWPVSSSLQKMIHTIYCVCYNKVNSPKLEMSFALFTHTRRSICLMRLVSASTAPNSRPN